MMAGAPWYVLNQTLHADLSITTVEKESQKRVDKHFQRLQEHEIQLAINLVDVRKTETAQANLAMWSTRRIEPSTFVWDKIAGY